MADLSLPDDYAALLDEVSAQVRRARTVAIRAVNTRLVELYWEVGTTILRRQAAEGWGAKVIDRLADDLRRQFPDMTGLSRSNLKSMRQFAAAYPGVTIGQQPVGQIPWGHVMTLLQKLDEQAERDWYARQVVVHGWSRSVLLNQIKNQSHLRVGAAPSNFRSTMSPEQCELAQELTKDPYVFDFLDLSGQISERELEDELIGRIQDTLREFGNGFAFVGRQVHFEVDGDDCYVDLLLFHLDQLRFVVVELKIGKFSPQDLGQLGFYVALVDAQRRNPDAHHPTVGILLCAEQNERVVQYALSGVGQAMAVATYTYDTLPADVRSGLPAPEQVIAAVDMPLSQRWPAAERERPA
ncbi:PDDEXK nuclease domain-containing protein [Nocardioides nitrophenolicus]|uniref:PDDEXK nuclease domain-containing protein n=1 Tax=Nocardioides nitrophenolicus TaxID=60489 RepID=UPI00195BA9DC|nr:PDDEXK nuclease domain-containing protein [Nocardioides nitrophenolicus]MBM7516401.1 putative nuclease of restriction endonuclease-like (RecB) superfamily [Nocardioides nitrophenolicus]